MSQEEDVSSALEHIHPKAISEWKRRAKATGPERAWADYTILLNHFAEALNRAPYTAEACDNVNIVELINTEFAYLAEALAFIFPNGAMMHKPYDNQEEEQEK